MGEIQLNGELGQNKSKENQAKILGFPWIYSSDSGLFNGLRRIQIKNSVPRQLAFEVVGQHLTRLPPLRFSSPLDRSMGGLGSVTGKTYNTDFGFRKAFAAFLSATPSADWRAAQVFLVVLHHR
jgi:hypothetical protein